MNQQYWDDLAENFNERVFEIADNEVNGALEKTVKALGKRYETAGDFGCGAGGTTPLLAAHFDRVVAVDYAQKLLKQAKKRATAKNIRFLQADLSAKKPPAVNVDVAFCINALLHPSAKKRRRIAASVFACTKKGGRAVVVVPAFESFLRTHQMLVECRVNRGQKRSRAVRAAATLAEREVHSLVEGIVDVGGTSTKHHMHDELVQQLENVGFKIDSVARVEFPWAEVLDDAPVDLDAFHPWDWLAIARK